MQSPRYAGLFHPGDSFDYNIFAQAGWSVEHPREGDPRPLGGLTTCGMTGAPRYEASADGPVKLLIPL